MITPISIQRLNRSGGGALRSKACLLMLFLSTVELIAQTVTVTTDHFSYLPGENILAFFTGGPGNPKDWIGVYPDGITPSGNPASTIWFYTDNTKSGLKGLAEGSVTFTNGLNLAGDWVAFFLRNDGYSQLAKTAFRVIDPTQTFIRTDKRFYVTGENISVAFTNGPANAKDWVGIYPEDKQPSSSNPSLLWFYVNGTRNPTTGVSEGAITFTNGLKSAGNYTVYLLQDDGYTALASEPFSVTEPPSTTPRLLSIFPVNHASNLPPLIQFSASITNGNTKVVSNSVALLLDEAPLARQLVQQNDLITVSFTNETLLAPGSTHAFQLVFSDNATNRFTNQVSFTVANYRNVVLPAPIVFENFDSTDEGKLPPGWSEVSFTEILTPELDFQNLDSAAYATWTVVNVDRFKGSFVTYSNPDGPQSEKDDYQRVLSVNLLNVLNGQIVRNLATGRMAFGNAGYRRGRSQVLFLFTPDFNLTGKTDVHLVFHSLWEQNQDSIAAAEFSIDEGKTWLPLVYMLHGPDIVKDTNGVVDAVATFTDEHPDVARYDDPATGEEKGANYGDFIGATISQELAAFISERLNDDPVESKRIEIFRLAQADNQPKVRFRFAHAGTDSWYFGIDNFGLYSMPGTGPRLSVRRSANQVVISWPGETAGFVLESADNLSAPNWAPVTGVANNSVAIDAATNQRFFRLRK